MDTATDAAGVPDPLLVRFLETPAGAARERLLADLMTTVVEPVARRVCRARLRGEMAQDADDVAASVVLNVLGRLQALRPQAAPIADFAAYVAAAAANGCRDHARARHPERWRLKARIRYVLAHQPGLAAWTEGGETWCGFAAWQDAGRRAPAAALDRLRHDASARRGDEPLPDTLAAVFDRVGGALLLDELVHAVARLLGIADVRLVEVEEADALRAAPVADALAQHDERAALRALWSEIRQLPPRQRAALLLNLRDAEERDAIALFPMTGAASLREIAVALEMSAERLAALWPRLPLPDAEIALLLGLTRQQVINLRKCARERLARRLGVSTAAR
jgi:hypothetical protein